MSSDDPKFSIGIPTYNRADFLDDCLSRLAPLLGGATPFEIIVSDNGSTDNTSQVIKAHSERNRYLRSFRQSENRGSWSNFLNTIYLARGDIFVYLADDDSLILDALLTHVERMRDEPDLSVIYSDWAAWDDQRGVEMHRYFALETAVSFSPEDPLGLVNFALQRMLMPEIGVYRRKALLGAHSFYRRALPFHSLMYALSRRGRVRFDPLVFYREHRVPRSGLQRTHWANMDMQMQWIGDEMRLTLESLLLLALQDAGQSHLPDDQLLNAKRAIDRILHSRAALEIERACARGDWISAVELRRRQVLWDGPGSLDRVRDDVFRLVLPAAAQAIALAFESLSEVDAVCLRGFAGTWLAGFFAQWRPEIPLLTHGEVTRALVVHRDEGTLAQDPEIAAIPNVLVLERLVGLYRVAREKFDISGL